MMIPIGFTLRSVAVAADAGGAGIGVDGRVPAKSSA